MLPGPSGAPIPKPAWNWWDPAPSELATQWRTTPVVIDLDEDGLNDLVMLDHEGYLAFFHRKRLDDQLWLEPGRRIFTDPAARPLRLNAGVAGRSGRESSPLSIGTATDDSTCWSIATV